MAATNAPIVQLDQRIQSQIRSSAQISSLSEVVLELAKNSIDARAKHVNVQLDFLRGYCSVADDGCGIAKAEFTDTGSLAKLYFTSKADHERSYGRYGRFLALLSSVSVLSITSRQPLDDCSNVIVLNNGIRIATGTHAKTEDTEISSYGTKVVVHSLFGKMPVRVKQLVTRLTNQSELEKEFHLLRKSLVGLLLAASATFSLSVHSPTTQFLYRPRTPGLEGGTPLVEVQDVVSTLFQASIIESPDSSSWRQASIHSPTLSIHAVIDLRPSPSKSVQFVSLNQQDLSPEHSQLIRDQVNALFDASSFGSISNTTDDGIDLLQQGCSVAKGPITGKKELDRWPKFYIKIDLRTMGSGLHELAHQETGGMMKAITGVLHALVMEFLKSHEFKFDKKRKRVKSTPPQSRPEAALGASSLDTWSRVKSGSSTTADLLSGLPFIVQTTSDGCTSSEPRTVDDRSHDGALQWTNVRTGKTLHVNARTGFALQMTSSDGAALPSHNRRLKNLDDIIDSLNEYRSLTKTEPALQSVVSNYEPFFGYAQNFDDSGHICTVSDHGSTLISGSPTATSLKITAHDLMQARILGQVDNKFILASIISRSVHNTTLILIDQHAADERVKVEKLFQQLCTNQDVKLRHPITFEISQSEVQYLRDLQPRFAAWHVHYSISNKQVRVSATPDVIAERCSLEPKLLIDLLRKEIWQERAPTPQTAGDHWLSKISACPQGILDMLSSRACRSAIMFNDKLTHDECNQLIKDLCKCTFPFQCAHGRPSLTVLAQVRDIDAAGMEGKDSTFGHGWKAWDAKTCDWL